MVAQASYGYRPVGDARATAQWLHYDEHAGVSDHPHTASQGQPRPSSPPRAPAMESHYPAMGNDDVGMDGHPPIVRLDPWSGANADKGDME